MSYKPIKSVDFLVIHCSATKADQNVGRAEIDRWHRERGWFEIGYHYVVRRDGTVEPGRPEDKPGAHVRGLNHLSLGICLAGGVGPDGRPAANFTPQQAVALRDLVDDLTTRYPNAEVVGHRDCPNVNKACPSFDARSWWKRVLDDGGYPPLV